MTLQQQAEDYLAAGLYDKAGSVFEQCYEQDPEHPQWEWFIGLCALLQHQVLEAQWIWQSALAMSSGDDTIRVFVTWLQNQAYQFQSQADYPQAALILEQLVELGDETPLVYHSLAWILTESREFDRAIEMWHQVIERDPNSAAAYHHLGRCYQRLGQVSRAQESLQRAVELDPTWSQSWLELSHIQRHHNQVSEAQMSLVKAIELDPTNPELYGVLASLHRDTGDLEATLVELSRAVQLDVHFFQTLCQAHPSETTLFQLLLCPHRTPEQDRILRGTLAPPRLSAPPSQVTTARSISSNWLPIGGYEHTQDWVQQQSHLGQWVSVTPAHTISLTPPQTYNPEIIERFRGGQIRSPETFVATLIKGRLHVNTYPTLLYADYGCAILTPDCYLLADLSSCLPTPRFVSRPYTSLRLHQHPILSLAAVQDPLLLTGSAVALPLGAMNYFHWMVDVLPCLWILQLAGYSFDQFDYFLVHGYKGSRFQQLTLERLGISPRQIINVEDPSQAHCQADHLVVPSLAGHISYLTADGASFLRELFLPQRPSGPPFKRIYISRQGAKWRRVINEADLVDMLAGHGFESVQMEALTVLEQAALMQSAEAVISIHGAGLTNIVFCEPGTRIIEILPCQTLLPYFWVIAQQCHLSYYALQAQVCRSPSVCQLLQTPYLDREDVVVDLGSVEQLLNDAKL